MRRIAMAAAVALLMVNAALPALERSSSDSVQARQVEQRVSVLKPLYLFNMRGRKDPFANVNSWQPAGSNIFSISGLDFKGLMEVDGQSSALFVSVNDKAVFTLRGSRLFGSNDKAVAGVSGRIMNEKEVRLRQGEITLNFSALRAPKRKL
jgi:hypothetical protein